MSDGPDLGRICQSCGLCCNGTLYRRARLRDGEIESAKRNKLRVLESGEGFEQPCSRLENNTCSIYAERPYTCQKFECALLARHRMEGGPVEPGLEAVRRAKELIAILESKGLDMTPGAERTITADGPEGFELMALTAELMQRLDRDFRRAE